MFRLVQIISIVIIFSAAFISCGNPIPDGFPELGDNDGMALTYNLDGESQTCTTAATPNSYGDDFNGSCDNGYAEVYFDIDQSLGEKILQCTGANDISLWINDNSQSCLTSGKVNLMGNEDGYAWGTFSVEYPSHSITSGEFSFRHEDKGVYTGE